MLKVKHVVECLYWIREYRIELTGKSPGRLLLKKPDKLLFWCRPVLVQQCLSPTGSYLERALADHFLWTEKTVVLYQQKGFSSREWALCGVTIWGHCTNCELIHCSWSMELSSHHHQPVVDVEQHRTFFIQSEKNKYIHNKESCFCIYYLSQYMSIYRIFRKLESEFIKKQNKHKKKLSAKTFKDYCGLLLLQFTPEKKDTDSII